MSLHGLDLEWWEHVAPSHEQYVGDQRADDFDHDWTLTTDVTPGFRDEVVCAASSRAPRIALPHKGGASHRGLTDPPSSVSRRRCAHKPAPTLQEP